MRHNCTSYQGRWRPRRPVLVVVIILIMAMSYPLVLLYVHVPPVLAVTAVTAVCGICALTMQLYGLLTLPCPCASRRAPRTAVAEG